MINTEYLNNIFLFAKASTENHFKKHFICVAIYRNQSRTLIVIYSQKKDWISFVFYCFENPSTARNFETTEPILVGFSGKCTSPNGHFNQIENWKCHMFNFRLIPLDRISKPLLEKCNILNFFDMHAKEVVIYMYK